MSERKENERGEERLEKLASAICAVVFFHLEEPYQLRYDLMRRGRNAVGLQVDYPPKKQNTNRESEK